MSEPVKHLTVKQVAERLALRKPDSVLRLIHKGALQAFNVAASGSKRPTWRIAEADLQAFLESRRAMPAVVESRPRRRKKPERITQYF